nr:immunoglobulin light chain junction region [Macaca mulatta]MOY13560.1 immunoglobulin light chain junction region [Macaca mulatta]
CLQFKNYPFTF